MTKPDPSTNNDRARELTLHWLKAQPVVEAFVGSVLRNRQASEDVVQQVAVTTVEKFETWDRECAFTTWAVGIARNKIRHHIRKQARDRHYFDDETVAMLAQAHTEIQSQASPMRDALAQCLKRLKGRGRKAVEMRYLREMSGDDIAQQMGLSRNNVFVILHRVRVELGKCIRQHMSKEGGRESWTTNS